MKRVVTLLIFGLTSFLSAKIDCPEASKFIDVKLGDFVFRRWQFIKNNECVISSDTIFINKKTNKRRKIEGFVTDLKMHNSILQVNTLAGAHTHIVYFYSIDKNGTLHDIKGGVIGSDAGDIIVKKDPNLDIIEVYTKNQSDQFIGKKRFCRAIVLNMYRYEDGIFKHTIKDKKIYEEYWDDK